MRARRLPLYLIAILAACALGGCTVRQLLRGVPREAATAPAPQATPGTAQSLLVRPPATAADFGCVPLEGEAVITRPDDGLCFAYPMRFQVTSDTPQGLSVKGQPLDKSPDPVRATFELTVSAAAGNLDAAAAEAMAQFAGFTQWKIERSGVTLGGQPAVELQPVPGRLSGRLLLAVHGGRLYRLYFWPVDVSQAAPDVTDLYDGVVRSWQFLPATPAGK